MAKYKRYQKLQKYYLGKPVEPAEYKEGELIATDCTLGECNGDARIEQTTEHLCNNWEEYDLVTTNTSYDCGKTWETSTVKENLKFNVLCSDYTYDTNEYEYTQYITEAKGIYCRVHMFTHSDGDIYALILRDLGYQPSSGKFRYIHTYYLYRYHKSTSSLSLVKDFNSFSTTENMWYVNNEYYVKNSYF